MRFVVVALCSLPFFVACPPPGPTEGEGDAAEGEGDGSEGEGEPFGAPLLATCSSDAACASGLCTDVFDGDFSNNFCTAACVSDDDCDFGGAPAACLPVSATSAVCFPTCTTSADCTGFSGERATGACFDNDGDGVDNLCFSFNASGFCDDGSACDDGEACTLVGSGLKFEFLCTPSAAGNVGDTCDATALARRGLPCESVTDCPANFACVDEDGQPGGTRVCSASEEENCGAFICWEQGFCAGACDADSDCPADWSCDGFDFGSGPVVHLCRPGHGLLQPCERDGDCETGEACALRTDDNAIAVGECVLPNVGDVAAGADCGDKGGTFDEVEDIHGCTSNLCTNDSTCAVLCSDDADCGGNACIRFEAGNNDPETVFGVCVDGPRCDADNDCDAGELCFRNAGPDGSVSFCTSLIEGGLSAGDVCDEATNANLKTRNITCFNDADCSAVGGAGYVCDLGSNSCVAPLDQLCQGGCFLHHCLQNCASDNDCGDPAYVCSGNTEVIDANDRGDVSDDETDDFGLCLFLPGSRTPCARTADCGVDEVCSVYVDRQSLEVLTVCIDRKVDDADLGAACGAIGVNFVACEDVCADDEDGAAAHCRAICSVDADCTGGLVCRPFSLSDVVPARTVDLCQAPLSAGEGEGEGE